MPSTWTVVEPSLPALTFTYSFGPGLANTLALVTAGGVVLVSPPCNPPEEAFTGLEKHGPVRALVAPNAYHHMGLPAWKARFPEAQIFAPAQSIARVEKQQKLSGIRPVAEMGALLGEGVEIVDMPHYKTGEVLVRWRAGDGWAWYVTDVMMNMPEVPPGMFGLFFKWSGSCPGLRRNFLATTFMVKDKRSLFGWLAEEARQKPPTVVVPCHGDVLRPADPPGAIAAALA